MDGLGGEVTPSSVEKEADDWHKLAGRLVVWSHKCLPAAEWLSCILHWEVLSRRRHSVLGRRVAV